MSIYHLHIPRTTGGYIRKLLLNSNDFNLPVVGHYRKIISSDLLKSDFVSGHYGATPYDTSRKIFTVVRDPNELTFSYIKYLSGFSGKDSFNESFLQRYLYESDLRQSVTNVLSKFLCLPLDLDRYNLNIDNHLYMAHNSWCLEDGRYSSDLAIENIKTYNIKIFRHGSVDLVGSIADYLNLKVDSNNTEKVNKSTEAGSDLYEKYYSEINQANDVDIDLYSKVAA